MKRYQSHKVVAAFKIEGVVHGGVGDTTGTLGPDDVLLLPDRVIVSTGWLSARCGQSDPIGGFFVRYPDNYESWSPAASFEAGYKEMPADAH